MTTRCLNQRCRKPLTDPVSKLRGRGRVCWERWCEANGLVKPKRVRAARRPKAEAVAEQVPLFELETEEINESEE